MKPLLENHWHHLPQEEVLDLLETQDRQQNFGPNALTQRKGRGLVIIAAVMASQPLPVLPAGPVDQYNHRRVARPRAGLRSS